jgi:hypothetical protein
LVTRCPQKVKEVKVKKWKGDFAQFFTFEGVFFNDNFFLERGI